MWEIWSNGLYKSTLHRVVHRGSNYRYALPSEHCAMYANERTSVLQRVVRPDFDHDVPRSPTILALTVLSVFPSSLSPISTRSSSHFPQPCAFKRRIAGCATPSGLPRRTNQLCMGSSCSTRSGAISTQAKVDMIRMGDGVQSRSSKAGAEMYV